MLQLLGVRTRGAHVPISAIREKQTAGKRVGWGSVADGASPIADNLVGLVEPASSPTATFLIPQLGQRISFLVDTGSPVSLLPWSVTNQKVSELHLYEGRVLSVSGEALDIVGQCGLELRLAGRIVEQDFLVARGVGVPILGVDFLRKNSIVIDVARRVLELEGVAIPFDGGGGPKSVGFHSEDPEKFEQALKRTLDGFSDIIGQDGNYSGGTHLIEHDIILHNDTPVHVRPRPVPFHLRDVVQNQISKMLELGVIKKSTSPWSSPILLVPKANGKYRFCVDFRQVNSKSVRDILPVPRIDTIFSLVGGARIFSTLDLLSGFWQVPMAEQARKYTAFSVCNQHFEFLKMPFGLSGSPATFVRLMNIVLEGLKNVMVYGDDVLVFSATRSEHIDHLSAVMGRLRQAGLVVNAEKCQFGKREVKFLGHVLSAGKISTLPEKVASVQEFPRPTSRKQLQSFLGLANFYRRFVRAFADLASPLYDLLRKGVSWVWEVRQESAFQELKRRLCEDPVVLTIPDFKDQFEVSTDASNEGLGAVLSQKGKVVEYASRRLSSAEVNYSATDRELLAIVWAVEKWREYLFGCSFIVYTDHRPITYLLTLKDPKGRMARWIARLQEYSFEVRYRPGIDNDVADCLSRRPVRLPLPL